MERSRERSADKKQKDLRDLEEYRVQHSEKKNSGEYDPADLGGEHLTLAEAERFRTCRLSEAGAMDFIKAVNAHLMLCPHCRDLVQANNDLGDALDAAEES